MSRTVVCPHCLQEIKDVVYLANNQELPRPILLNQDGIEIQPGLPIVADMYHNLMKLGMLQLVREGWVKVK